MALVPNVPPVPKPAAPPVPVEIPELLEEQAPQGSTNAAMTACKCRLNFMRRLASGTIRLGQGVLLQHRPYDVGLRCLVSAVGVRAQGDLNPRTARGVGLATI